MDAVEEIKSRLNIEDVVSEYVQLKRAGRNYKGLSPFTSENTPSFIVSPEKGIWHDFSSGKGGNMFSFVMEMEGLDFRGALEHLARKANIDLSQYQSGQSAARGQQKEKLYVILELATKFYQVQFSHAEVAYRYVFEKRKFAKPTVLDFRIGYSPNNGRALLDFLKKQGHQEADITKAGLTARSYRGGVQDMFRGRLMIPLMDAQGRVIGFTARLLEDDPSAPKYINTPQTILYDKSRHVFGLHLAKEAIRRSNRAVMVEGNLDVIASHQAGVKEVVATAGTALTAPHLKALARFTSDIRLAFDQDRAGIAAAERAIPIAAKAKVSLSIITIPEGKDPDELVRKNPALWQEVIDKNAYALDWLINKYKTSLDITSAVGKREFSDVLLRVVSRLEDQVEQDHYLTVIGEVIGVGADALRAKMLGIEKTETPTLKQPKSQLAIDVKQADQVKIQNHLLSLTLLHPKLRDVLQSVTPEMLIEPRAKQLLEYLQQHLAFTGTPTELQQLLTGGADDGETLPTMPDYVKMLSLQHETLYQGTDDAELALEAKRLQIRLIEQYVKTKKVELAARMRQAGQTDMQQLLTYAKDLDSLLKMTKEHAADGR